MIAVGQLRQLDYGKLLLLAPRDDTKSAFLDLLSAAERSITIAIYGCTLAEAIDVLIGKHYTGVAVRVLLDHTQACGTAERAQVARLAAAGVPHWIGTSPKAHQILHSKITVVDGELVESGSWNYSASAADQFNTFVLERSPDAAAKLESYIGELIAWVQANEPQYQNAKGDVS